MVQDDSVQALFEEGNVEVDQITQCFAAEFQIGLELKVMHRRQRLNGLYFKNDALFDKQVQSVTFIEWEGVVDDGLRGLAGARAFRPWLVRTRDTLHRHFPAVPVQAANEHGRRSSTRWPQFVRYPTSLW